MADEFNPLELPPEITFPFPEIPELGGAPEPLPPFVGYFPPLELPPFPGEPPGGLPEAPEIPFPGPPGSPFPPLEPLPPEAQPGVPPLPASIPGLPPGWRVEVPGQTTPGTTQPPITFPPTVVTQSSQGGGATAVAIASINQQLQIVNQDVQPLADAVTNAIKASIDSVQATVDQLSKEISNTISGASNALFGWIKSLGEWLRSNIGSILNGISNAIQSIAKAVYNALRDAVTGFAKFFQDNVVPVLRSIEKAIHDIDQFYRDHIQPILQAIAETNRIVSAAVVAIEKDLKGGITGLLQLPTDVANALTGLDASLQRAAEALSEKQFDINKSVLFGSSTIPPGGFSKVVQDSIAGLWTTKLSTTFKPTEERLTEPTLAEELPKIIDAMNQIAVDLVKGIWRMIPDPTKLMEIAGLTITAVVAELVAPVEIIWFLWEILKKPLETIGELAAERVRENIPILKLDPATLVEAWRRKFIDEHQMNREMLVQGYNEDRSKLLRDLATHIEDIQSLVDYRYRGIITDDDFRNGLSDLGFTTPQVEALLEGSQQILDLGRAGEAHRRFIIDDQGFAEVAQVNRYDTEQTNLLKQLLYRPPTADESLIGRLRRDFAGTISGDLSEFDTIDSDYLAGSHIEGLDEGATRARWWSSFNTLDAGTWITLYFRNLRTSGQLEAKLTELRIPRAFHKDIIDASRPLIPFRTIPGMVAAKVISESDALRMLQEHGYSLENAVRLLQYATRGSKSSKATTAQASHQTSLATARTAFDDGVITEAQYLELLKEHGLDDQAASVEIELAKITADTKARKQIGTDILNEFQAGLIDETQAGQAVNSSGLTLPEQAKIFKSIRSASKLKGKMPSEAELRQMAVKEIISVDDYESALVSIGFPSLWAGRFRALHFPESGGSQSQTSGG